MLLKFYKCPGQRTEVINPLAAEVSEWVSEWVICMVLPCAMTLLVLTATVVIVKKHAVVRFSDFPLTTTA